MRLINADIKPKSHRRTSILWLDGAHARQVQFSGRYMLMSRASRLVSTALRVHAGGRPDYLEHEKSHRE
jgi:hypothetical protein